MFLILYECITMGGIDIISLSLDTKLPPVYILKRPAVKRFMIFLGDIIDSFLSFLHCKVKVYICKKGGISILEKLCGFFQNNAEHM